MIFIFGFAKNYLLEKSYVYFMIQFELYLTISTDFSYVNYNRNELGDISIVFYIGKVCSHVSNIAQILS